MVWLEGRGFILKWAKMDSFDGGRLGQEIWKRIGGGGQFLALGSAPGGKRRGIKGRAWRSTGIKGGDWERKGGRACGGKSGGPRYAEAGK